MSPKHIDNITDPKRRAIAPYNFVELPEKVVEAELPLPEGDRYHCDRHTGKIECTLTTESPLYTRCGWSPDDFAKYGETAFNDYLPDDLKKLRANFFINPATDQPVIPGSSIRGMLRTLVEIVSFSKIERVSGHQRLFFRAVGSNPQKESWGKEYKQYVDPKIVKAGYLIKNGGTWLIQPAVENNCVTFAWVEENELTNIEKFKKVNDREYEPQYFSVIYESLKTKEIKKNGRVIAEPLFAWNISFQKSDSSSQVVTSGNMRQTTDDENEKSPRRNHCIVFPQNKQEKPLEIDHMAIEHYCNALTEFQKTSPLDKDWGVLKEGRPVFYYHDEKSTTVGFFGQSPNFRIPYSPEGNGHATTVLDFIPSNLRELTLIDLADAIFGWVKEESENKKLPEGFDKQRSGRIFVTDALYESNKDGIWYSENLVTPQILSEPKPSYFPHYLVQTDADKLELKHYASKPLEETVIRGHKLYWHKGSNPDFKLPPPKKVIGSSKKGIDSTEKNSDTQKTLIKPVKTGVTFKFDIHFENLSNVELGALLWVLSLSSDKSQQLKTGKTGEKYCFSLGMGKPLGMGAVKIDYELHLSDRTARYSQLFNGNKWSQNEKFPDKVAQNESNSISEFEKHILGKISKNDDFADKQNRQQLEVLKQIPRIEMLLAMLRCDQTPDVAQTRYMTIEAKEYQNRPILPTPLQVSNPNGASSGSSRTPKPRLKKSKSKKQDQQSQQQHKPRDNSGESNSAVLARPQNPNPNPKPKPKPKLKPKQ